MKGLDLISIQRLPVRPRWFAGLGITLLAGALAGSVRAQEPGKQGAAAADANNVKLVDAEGHQVDEQGASTPAPAPASYAPASGYYPAPGTDINQHLPSSSKARSDINAGDGFDFDSGAPRDVPTLRGRPNAPAATPNVRGASGPALHTVKKGDTLWDISAQRFNNPWAWTELWSYNPQVKNPHWIYPGDQIRLGPVGSGGRLRHGSLTLGGGPGSGQRSVVPVNTVFLRDVGYIDKPEEEIWGELVGSREEQQLLAHGNTAVLIIRSGVKLQVGQELSIFREVRSAPSVSGARTPPGTVVAIQGAVRITSFDPQRRVAEGEIIESLDVIERGARVGPVGRRFAVVPPKPSGVELTARVLGGLYPHEFFGQQQVLFVDRGTRDGLREGNRLFVIRQGDTWRRTLDTASDAARARVLVDVPDKAQVEMTPIHGDEETFPPHVVAQLSIVRAHEFSSLALVTRSRREVEPGDRAVAIKGR